MRYADWQSRLYNAIETKRNVPFVWGVNDCMMFSADMVLALTGVDHAAEFRGTYNTKASARAVVVRRTGTNDVVGIIDAKFNRVPVMQARRGDLVATQIPERGTTIGVCAGGGCYFVGADGLVQYPLQNCVTAWRVC